MPHLFVPNKYRYVRGERPNVKCILCAIRDNDKRVKNLTVYSTPIFIVSMNLYPYSPGHLLIFPKRHITDIRNLTKREELAASKLKGLCLDVLDQALSPHGYNIGLNLGSWSGASIPHLHWHIVPRFKNEIGFIDIIAGTRLIVDNPAKSRNKVAKLFKKFTYPDDL